MLPSAHKLLINMTKVPAFPTERNYFPEVELERRKAKYDCHNSCFAGIYSSFNSSPVSCSIEIVAVK